MSVSTVNAALGSLTQTAQETTAAVAGALRSGTYTPRQVGHLRATLQGLADDAWEIRHGLDAGDVTRWQLTDRADDTIALWTWERTVRKQLVRFQGQVRKVDEVALQLSTGRRQQTHMVRSGETLQALAARYLGAWTEWPRIAEANGLAPGQPASGTVLVIPDRR
ncbi:LysM peptidoglycan-binding domain-containing protein [uncultured Nocardioides sp.]|uniref:LysM peptidoglycan-binding domain-containing protein n=1 Tax=uncultured Nocardioides sp. TaxID=198441 RepID=UPI00261F02AE|nr:LysM peptidoglycan-binding domain-containing protein [uncultured Nocardioides sp.]